MQRQPPIALALDQPEDRQLMRQLKGQELADTLSQYRDYLKWDHTRAIAQGLFGPSAASMTISLHGGYKDHWVDTIAVFTKEGEKLLEYDFSTDFWKIARSVHYPDYPLLLGRLDGIIEKHFGLKVADMATDELEIWRQNRCDDLLLLEGFYQREIGKPLEVEYLEFGYPLEYNFLTPPDLTFPALFVPDLQAYR